MSKNNEVLALECLKRMDAQGDLFELFSDNVEIMYPKWGVANGKEEVGKMLMDFGGYLRSTNHDYDGFNYISHGNTVVVEGVSSGELANGMTWQPDGEASGRFCTVFQITEQKISRMYVYLDPDYCDQFVECFPWRENST